MNPRALAVGAVGALAAAAVQTGRRWAGAIDPCGPGEYDLPGGEPFKVTTDDGAVLDGVILGAGLAAGDAGRPTVVMAHCWMGNRSVWAPVANRLVASGHRVVLYDQRGHGESTWGVAEPGIDRLGADLAAVLEGLDISGAVVAGHSMGGMAIMAYLASAAQERVTAAVLVATGAARIVSRPARAAGVRTFGNPRVERLLQRRIGPAMMRTSMGRRPVLTHMRATRANVLATSGDVRLACFAAICAMDLRPALGAITTPTTVVVGTRDLLTPPRRARAITAAIPGARLVTIPDAGHMLPFETPEAIADLITEALR